MIQSSVDQMFIYPWLELNFQSAFVLIVSTDYTALVQGHGSFLMVRTRFSYADLTPPVFQDLAVKLTTQGQAKL